jgi:pilus assembly protein Flp/PilA
LKTTKKSGSGFRESQNSYSARQENSIGRAATSNTFHFVDNHFLTACTEYHRTARPKTSIVGEKQVYRFSIQERCKKMKEKLVAFIRDEEGLTIVEYAVAAGLITATVAASFGALGAAAEGVITTITGYI